MKTRPTALPEVVLIDPAVFPDRCGYFFEAWHSARYGAAGLPNDFPQDNVSCSQCGALRGLHFQEPNPQGQLVYVLQGEVFDVAVDIRVGSPSFGQWVGEFLSDENQRQLYLPPGFAHGFCTLSDTAVVGTKCTEFYEPEGQFSIRWDDPELSIDWPVEDPLLSEKDEQAPTLAQLRTADKLPRWRRLARHAP